MRENETHTYESVIANTIPAAATVTTAYRIKRDRTSVLGSISRTVPADCLRRAPVDGLRGMPTSHDASSSDSDDRMGARVEGKITAQSIDECGTVLVEKIYETDDTLLGLATGERLTPGMTKLPAQGVILALGRLDDLAVELFEVVLHPSQRRSRCPFERRIDDLHVLRQTVHPLLNRARRLVERGIHRRRQLRLEHLVQHRFVLCAQRLHLNVVSAEEAHCIGVEYRRRRPRLHEGHRHRECLIDVP